MSVIINIATAVPEYKHQQKDLADFMSSLFQYSDQERRKLKLMYAKSGIETRYSAIPDFFSDIDSRIFFPKTKNLEPFPDVEYRMRFYGKAVLPVCVNAIEECLKNNIDKASVTHLITVSCTGLSAPGLDIDIVQHFNLNEDINRTSINFMGCYAAIHALKQADYICKSEPDAVVLIVAVELCTIHFQKINDADNLMANLLFADGAGAAIVVSDSNALRNNKRGLSIQNFYSRISLNGKSNMAWQITSSGFLMTLSSYIPKLIESGIKDLLNNALTKMKLNFSDITHWAIHPGGKKILEVIQSEFGLQQNDLESSWKTLRDYGNMSSATILFVLKDILENKVNIEKEEWTFTVAFGPGLTMESILLKNV